LNDSTERTPQAISLIGRRPRYPPLNSFLPPSDLMFLFCIRKWSGDSLSSVVLCKFREIPFETVEELIQLLFAGGILLIETGLRDDFEAFSVGGGPSNIEARVSKRA
jgi:hypothetical protein